MRSLKKFMSRLFSQDFWWLADNLHQQLEAQLAGKIPIFGEIGICKMEPYKIVDADFEKIQHSHTINIYPVAKIGSEPWMWRPGKEATINWADELPERFADTLAANWQIPLPEDQIVYLGGQAQTEKQSDGQYIDCQWDLLCLSPEVLDRIQRQTNLSIVADSDGVAYLDRIPIDNDEAYRIVYPQEMVITDLDNSAKYHFLISGGLIRFIRFHRSCAEYITLQGVKVFDNREAKCDGLPCWKAVLKHYVDALKPTTGGVSTTTALAWTALNLVVNGRLDNVDDRFGNNLNILTGSNYLSSSICTSKNMQVRVAFRDRHWWARDRFCFNEDVTNPYYIIVKD